MRASALTTLWHLKLAITEALNVHAKHVQVFARRPEGWQVLEGDELCLAGLALLSSVVADTSRAHAYVMDFPKV